MFASQRTQKLRLAHDLAVRRQRGLRQDQGARDPCGGFRRVPAPPPVAGRPPPQTSAKARASK